MRFFARIPAAVWAALAVALARALVACSRVDELELELYSGSLAWALVHGLPLDPAQLPIIPHNRGSVVFGVLLAPAFWAFGPRLWIVKALAVTFSAATAALLAGLTERCVSRRAALAAAALLALLPPSYQAVDVLALGSHGDSVLFTALALALLVAGREVPLSLGRALAFGLATGFAGFFSLQSVVALPALLAVWWLEDRSFWKRPTSLAALAAALVWILPARAMLGAESAGVIVNQSLSERLLPNGVTGSLAKWGQTFAVELPASWTFELHGGAWARWLLLAALIVGLVAILPRLARREPLAVFAVLYPALVVTAYACSNFQMKLADNLDGMGSRYLMPMAPFLALWIACACDRPPRIGGVWPARAALLGALAAGLAGWLALLDPLMPTRQPPVRATELAFFHGHLEHASAGDPARALAWIERLEPDWPAWRPLLHHAVALPGRADASSAPERAATIRAAPAPLAPYLWAQLGRDLSGERLETITSLALAPDELPWVLRGAGTELLIRTVAKTSRPGAASSAPFYASLAKQTASLAPPERDALLEGIGFQLGLRLTPYQPVLLEVLADSQALADTLAPAFYRGLAHGYRMRFLEADYETPRELSIERMLPERAREPFRAGLAP